MAWQRRVEDLQSCNYTTEAFVRSGPRCVSITVHLLITSNPKTWLSIVGYSSHDLKIALGRARLIPAVKPMWGLISLLDLTSRAIGFTSVSDDDILFLAPASPRQTWDWTNFKMFRYKRRWLQHWASTTKLAHITHPKWRHDTVWVVCRRLKTVGCLPSANMSTSKEEQLKHFCFVYWRATPSLSLGVVTANKGSNKSTEWSLLATIQLIIADTWDRWKEWYHNDFITVNGVRKAGKSSERLTILWFIDFQWRCKTVGKLLGWGGLTIIIKKINYYININALPCVINVFFQLFFGMRKKGNPHPICLNV